jgi:UDP-N-acetylglucosamine 4,6-dehydratase
VLNDKRILITGGTGSLGNKLVERICTDYRPFKLIIFSRDEVKQGQMKQKYDYDSLRYFLGDVRDINRVNRVMRGADIVIHAAALKQIPTLEYTPTEAILTNIDGTINVMESCIDNNVKTAVFISTDKAVNPINLYGATKLCAEKAWLAANSFNKTKFKVVRYGNVINSRGSVIELFLKLKEKGIKEFPITDKRMSRFWITLDEAVDLIYEALEGEKDLYIPVAPSMMIIDIARAIEPECTFEEIGIRPGEKLHETLCEGYHSDSNEWWMSREEFLEKLGI